MPPVTAEDLSEKAVPENFVDDSRQENPTRNEKLVEGATLGNIKSDVFENLSDSVSGTEDLSSWNVLKETAVEIGSTVGTTEPTKEANNEANCNSSQTVASNEPVNIITSEKGTVSCEVLCDIESPMLPASSENDVKPTFDHSNIENTAHNVTDLPSPKTDTQQSILGLETVTSTATTAQCSPIGEDENPFDFAPAFASGTSSHSSQMNMNENSNASMGSTDNSDFLGLSQEMIEEERNLALETEKEMAKRLENAGQLSKKEKEKRYKTLMNLLGKSNQYAVYMSQKLTEQKQAAAKKEAETPEMGQEESPEVLRNSTNRGTKRKRGAAASKNRGKKAKTEPSETAAQSYNPKTHYRNRMGFIVSRRQPQTLVGGVMRDYQLDGLEWMVSLYKNGVNGILADEMGLGKTIQTIALLCHLREKNIFGPHLIVAPLSTLPNWICEFANFAPDVPILLYHGNAEKREQIKQKFVEIMRSKDRSKFPVVLTSYEVPLRDRRFLSVVKWCYSIVDEGHRLKNYKSMLSQALRKYRTETRLLLTGTPLQNNLTELWSLLNYLIPEIFDDLPLFENLFDFSDLTDSDKKNQLIEKEKEEQIVSKMHQILEPFLLRRVKTDVKLSIPRKKEILVYAPLTLEQERLYKSVLDRSIIDTANPQKDETPVDGKRKRRCTVDISYSEDWDIDENLDYIPKEVLLSKSSSRKRITKGDIEIVYNLKICNPDMMLRKIVNHPYLVKTPVVPGTRDIIINEELIQQSGKMLVLDALLPRLKKEGHKVLLFSNFRIMLDLLEDYVLIRKHKYVRLDGLSKIEERLESIKQFNSDPETFIFLISTRAGGLGINLTGADTVIIYNSDWNPQVDLQAQDRCHRIGQTRPVVVYRFVTAGTIDERMVNRATCKRRLEKLVMKRGKFKQQATNKEEISLSELKELLESTDYKQVIYPNGLVLSDEQIECLLDRRDLLNDEEVKPVENKVFKVLENKRTGEKSVTAS